MANVSRLFCISILFTGVVFSSFAEINVGMISSAGQIEDRGYNELTWNGVKLAERELPIKAFLAQPLSDTHADYLKAIENLHAQGCRIVVASGFQFESAFFEAQLLYPDISFVLIDGIPNGVDPSGKRLSSLGVKTTSFFFSEEQAGFIAAVATSVHLQSGKLAFLGGARIEPVLAYLEGFKKGIGYATRNLGTQTSLFDEDTYFLDGFGEMERGRILANDMFDRGVKAVFSVAGSAGLGVIEAAKGRLPERFWLIGVDTDAYLDGIVESGTSVVLTSAVKRIDSAVALILNVLTHGKLQEGRVYTLDAQTRSIGIPFQNPNLAPAVTPIIERLYEDMEEGRISLE